MGDTRDRMGAAGVAVAGGFFKIALYVCVAVLIIWIGKVTYQFGYDIFNQHAMSPGEGQEVTVVIKEDATSYDIAMNQISVLPPQTRIVNVLHYTDMLWNSRCFLQNSQHTFLFSSVLFPHLMK